MLREPWSELQTLQEEMREIVEQIEIKEIV